MAVLIGVVALALTLPGIASAAPVTVIPGLPPVNIPDGLNIPGLPSTPKPSKPKPPSSTSTTPADPAIPNVKTSTGWDRSGR